MAKIICMETREEKDRLPFNEDDATALMRYLLCYKDGNTETTFSEHCMLSELYAFIENSAGVDRYVIMENKLKEELA